MVQLAEKCNTNTADAAVTFNAADSFYTLQATASSLKEQPIPNLKVKVKMHTCFKRKPYL